ncbi:hypothetical protein, partial [Pseudorhodobacter sp.]|uniref:hypothetical protein n=1 Tax=Pseudorhodobacter sp. TaxID=1934400 RepID=UPI002649AFC0
MERFFKVTGRGLQLLLGFGLLGWAALAVNFQLEPPLRQVAWGGWRWLRCGWCHWRLPGTGAL